MDMFSSFLETLILYTAGLGVMLFWAVVFVAIVIEIHDFIKARGDKITNNTDDKELS